MDIKQYKLQCTFGTIIFVNVCLSYFIEDWR